MKIVFCKYRNKLYAGNTLTCLAWAAEIAKVKKEVIPVYLVRAGSKDAKLIAEVDNVGVRLVRRGAFAKIRKDAQWVKL